MLRFVLIFASVLFASFPVCAQDMPLAQILIDGEEWTKVENPTRGDRRAVVTSSPDGTTTFRWMPSSGRFIEARQTAAPGTQPFVAYCPLRLKRGTQSIAVTSLATDRDGRIYAATEIGVQVFDPTGRMCGVLTPAAPGNPEQLAFEGDKLTLWIGDTKYARKLRTQGSPTSGRSKSSG